MLSLNRILHVETSTGVRDVPIQIMLPVPHMDRWECNYSIGWPEGSFESRVLGNDQIHAVHLALIKIGTDLHMSRYHAERRMWWLKPWVGYGFPMPKGARNDLIGHDQEFYGDAHYGKDTGG